MVDEFDPHLMFVNLGDIDRVGHADLTGTDVQPARQRRSPTPTVQVRRFVDLLKSHRPLGALDGDRARRPLDGLVAAQRRDQPRGALDADPLLAGKVAIADNGGADLLYWTGAGQPARRRGRSGCARSRAPRPACSPPTTGATQCAAARPGGRRRGRLLQGRLAVQRPGPDRQPDPGQPRPPGHPSRSRSSSPAATRRAPAADVLGPARARSTSRRRSRRSSGSAAPRRVRRPQPALSPVTPARVPVPEHRAGGDPPVDRQRARRRAPSLAEELVARPSATSRRASRRHATETAAAPYVLSGSLAGHDSGRDLAVEELPERVAVRERCALAA